LVEVFKVLHVFVDFIYLLNDIILPII